MVNKCFVCKKNSDKEPELMFHCFPSDLNMRKQWVEILKCNEHPKVSWRVCSSHFELKDYVETVDNTKIRLRTGAVPSVNLVYNQERVYSPETHNVITSNIRTRCFEHYNYRQIKEEVTIEDTKLQLPTEEVPSVNLVCIKKKEVSIQETPDIKSCVKSTNLENNNYKSSNEPRMLEQSDSNDIKDLSNQYIEFHSSVTNSPSGCTSAYVDMPPVAPGRIIVSRNRKSVWRDRFTEAFGSDNEFLNYKRIKDVNWEAVANDPVKAKMCWEVAVDTIAEKDRKIKSLQLQVHSLKAKIRRLRWRPPSCNNKFWNRKCSR